MFKYSALEADGLVVDINKSAVMGEGVKVTNLYTAHEIADFVRGLFDADDLSISGKVAFAIAERIEEEAK